MTPFTLFAPAKINLALHVLGRRADGYHDLDSIVAFADVGDTLTFTPAPAFAITASGPFAHALPVSADNIIAKAHAKISDIAAAHGKSLPPIAVHLVKNLPVASGIGGGSANAAAAMRGFLRLAGIDRIDDEIMAAALALGADVPVCLVGKPCRMRGVGERIAPLEHFKPRHAVLVNPGVVLSTPAVFGRLGLSPGQVHGAPIENTIDSATWRNDLMVPATAIAPAIGDVITALRHLHPSPQSGEGGEPQRAGGKGNKAPLIGMSGSGATCFRMIDNEAEARHLISEIARSHPDWWTAQTILS